MNTSPHRPTRAFTLVELLLTISILSILMAILWASLRAVRRYSREVSTRIELSNLEAAFRQYYDHYGLWPIPDEDTEILNDGDTKIYINEVIFSALAAKPDFHPDLNTDKIPFFELFRFREFNGKKYAVNAWGDTYGERYQVMFDTNGDNTLLFESITIPRAVIVWTEHPDCKNDSDLDKRILGSWQQ